MRPLARRLLGVLLTAGLWGAAAGAAAGPGHVVVIVADDLRADTLGFAGNAAVRTPHLDRLAARGAVFPRATCGYPICNVARSEMFSGRVALGSPGYETARGTVPLDPTWVLWPEAMRRAGWRTVFSGKWHIAGTPWKSGFGETAGLFSSGGGGAVKLTVDRTPTGRAVTGYTGWTFKTDRNVPQPELGVGLTPDTDRIMTDRAVEAIRTHDGRPLFLHVNFTAPHDPLHWPRGGENAVDPAVLALPPNFRSAPEFDTGNIRGRDELVVPAPRTAADVRGERALYFSQVENVDRQVGRILAALEAAGVLGRTLVVFTSDQGLALGSHGLMGKQNPYEHTLNVPLILAGPGVPSGARLPAQCHLRDVYPTVCELAGVPVPGSVQGRSLAPVLRGERQEIYEEVFAYFTDTQRLIRTREGWKLVWYPRGSRLQLFQVNEDPHELRDLAADPAQASRVASLQARLAAWQREHRDPAPLPPLAAASR